LSLASIFELLNLIFKNSVFFQSLRKLKVLKPGLLLWKEQGLIGEKLQLIERIRVVTGFGLSFQIYGAYLYYFYQKESIFPVNKTANLVDEDEMWVTAIRW